jgi:two-component system, sensor histidine kinase and response regulator
MPGPARKSEILVVDDTAENCALAQAILEDEGHYVRVARSGSEALRLFEEQRPDCLLLDVRMPAMDGFEVCERIRSLERGAGGADHCPIIILTALRDIDTFDRAQRAGADDFLAKPIQPAELAARVQTALKLKRMTSELREQYELIKKQRDALIRLQLQKDRLAAFIVHDLKNPAGAADLHAQLILRDPELSPRSKQSAQRIREEIRHLMRLVMNLLDISRSEQGELKVELGQVDLAAIVHEVFSTFEMRARNARVCLQSELIAPSVYANGDLLLRILENLVDNALRHAPEDSCVHVTSSVAPHGVEIRVRDFGSGIAPELRDKVFETFVQLEHGERAVSRTGRGLGLTFCKVTVHAHGGEIWIEDAQPGAVFCLRLPHDC